MVLGRYAFGRLGPFKARLRRKSGGTGRFIRQKLRRDFAFRKMKAGFLLFLKSGTLRIIRRFSERFFGAFWSGRVISWDSGLIAQNSP